MTKQLDKLLNPYNSTLSLSLNYNKKKNLNIILNKKIKDPSKYLIINRVYD